MLVGGLQVGNKRSGEMGDVCVMVMNAGEGRQRESAIKGMVMPPVVGKKKDGGTSRGLWNEVVRPEKEGTPSGCQYEERWAGQGDIYAIQLP